MILDILENAHRYLALHKGFAKAFEFLVRPDLKDLPVGKYEIDADRVYAIVSKEHGRRKEDALLETHEKYIDIQLVLAGTDDMGWKPKSLCKHPFGEYNQKNDEHIFTDEPDAWLSQKWSVCDLLPGRCAYAADLVRPDPQGHCKGCSGPLKR